MPARRRSARPIYVEARIRAPMDVLWELTQNPESHERWDARFTRIRYAEDVGDTSDGRGVVRFRYWLGLPGGPALTGTGVTTAERHRPDGSRISALRFAAGGGLSPLQEGSGYWRYTPVGSPTDESVLFATGYDYRGWRFPGGAWLDRWFVRPFVGWLTAWSFDCLRLWAEHGVPPERSRRRAVGEVAIRLGCSAVIGALAYTVTDGRAGVIAGAGCAVLVLLLSLLAPPSALTPAARRCARRPDRTRPARPPRLLDTLETP
ncbi:hypothetical protein F7Q99_18555 [Streptomyces kaniharaensis]|uniref:SRPBCC family protein n=1 Tax=Streptomyces kaniharaensis TaxID=212423 RepID=A0A6N7KV67_9ACTN|nr:hypothetical protein [Streptomyces kaniharaensis]MQS14218.1 hypothetical protein [Streptomyces kaniharaensis]